MEPYIWAIVCSALIAQVVIILWFESGNKHQLERVSTLYADAKNRERVTMSYLELALEHMPPTQARDLLVSLSMDLDPHRSTREQDHES